MVTAFSFVVHIFTEQYRPWAPWDRGFPEPLGGRSNLDHPWGPYHLGPLEDLAALECQPFREARLDRGTPDLLLALAGPVILSHPWGLGSPEARVFLEVLAAR